MRATQNDGNVPIKPARGPSVVGIKQAAIATLALGGIGLHCLLRFAVGLESEIWGLLLYDLPLITTLACGGAPLVVALAAKVVRREFGSDLLAGISIVTSVILHEYLAE